MSVIWWFVLPPVVFAGAVFAIFKLLEALGITSLRDFEIDPRSR
jgi:hypothetical protein